MSNHINIPIYKVNHLVNGKIDTIYIFYGSSINDKPFKEEIFKKAFTEKEYAIIQTNNINVIISEQQIHLDDTIGSIKIKIVNEFKNQCALEEIYLFCEKFETLHTSSLYQSLIQNKKIDVTSGRLNQLLPNIVSSENGVPFNASLFAKDNYDYNDLLQLHIDNQTYVVNKMLGQKSFIIKNEFPFVYDPFRVKNYDPFFEKNMRILPFPVF